MLQNLIAHGGQIASTALLMVSVWNYSAVRSLGSSSPKWMMSLVIAEFVIGLILMIISMVVHQTSKNLNPDVSSAPPIPQPARVVTLDPKSLLTLDEIEMAIEARIAADQQTVKTSVVNRLASKGN